MRVSPGRRGCSGASWARLSHGPPGPSRVGSVCEQRGRHSPDAVAGAVVALKCTIDTHTVHSWTDAARRAGPLLTPDYAGRLATAPSPAPDAQWSTWTAHHAYTAVQLHQAAEPHPPDTPTTAARAVNLTTTPYGRDGMARSRRALRGLRPAHPHRPGLERRQPPRPITPGIRGDDDAAYSRDRGPTGVIVHPARSGHTGSQRNRADR